MSRFRDIKNQARRDLHREAQVPAFYVAGQSGTPVLLHVRVHTKFEALGDLEGLTGMPAQRPEAKPKIIFMRDELASAEITLANNAVISVEAGEAYRIAFIMPPDGISVTAEVVALTPAQASGLPVPPANA